MIEIKENKTNYFTSWKFERTHLTPQGTHKEDFSKSKAYDTEEIENTSKHQRPKRLPVAAHHDYFFIVQDVLSRCYKHQDICEESIF